MYNFKFKRFFSLCMAAAIVASGVCASSTNVYAEDIIMESVDDVCVVEEVADEVVEESIEEVDLEVLPDFSAEDEANIEQTTDSYVEEKTDSLVETSTDSSSEIMVSGKEGEYSWKIDSKGKLTLEGTLPDSKVNKQPRDWGGWTNYKDSIKSAEVNISGPTKLNSMFSGCVNLKSVDLSGMNTSQVTTMNEMFSGCSKLETVYFGSINTSNVTTMKRMFRNCSIIETIVMDPLNTSSVTDMSGMFENCKKLSDVKISGFNTSSVTDLSSMFLNCKSLESISLTGFNTSSVDSMASMFEGCTSLTSVNVGNFDTTNVYSFAKMFKDCSKLTDLNISGFRVEAGKNVEEMFYKCSALKDLNLSNVDLSDVYKWGLKGLFTECKSLNTIETPVNLKYDVKLPATYLMPDGTPVKYLPCLDTSVTLTKKGTGTTPEDPLASAEISMPFDDITLGADKNNTYTVVPMVSNTNKSIKVVWSVEDENGNKEKGKEYLSIAAGRMRANPAGAGHTVVVTAKLKYGDKYGDSTSFTVNIVKKGESVELPEREISGKDDSTYSVYRKSKGIKLPVMMQTKGLKKITWKTSNSKVCTVTESGIVVPKKKGDVTIKAVIGKEVVEYDLTIY